MLDGEEFDELVLDIRENRLRRPIVLTADGETLIDGRNRYRACEKALADPGFEQLGEFYTEEMILDFIVSANVRRRHMNPGQRAMAALALEPMYAEAGKEARKAELAKGNHNASKTIPADLRESFDVPSGGLISSANLAELNAPAEDRRRHESTAKAAKAVGASPRAVQQAKAVERDAPDLARDVRGGKIALDAADRERKKRIAALPNPDPVPTKPKPSAVPLVLRTHDGTEVEYSRPSGEPTRSDPRAYELEQEMVGLIARTSSPGQLRPSGQVLTTEYPAAHVCRRRQAGRREIPGSGGWRDHAEP